MDKMIGMLMVLTGPCALVYAVITARRIVSFIRTSAEAPGEVVRLEPSRDGGRIDYAPVFTFAAADGNNYTVTSDVASSPPGFAVGDSVRVRYDPSDPTDARIDSFFQTWGSPLIVGLIGVMFIGVGSVITVSR